MITILKIFIMMVLTSLFVIGLWAIDIGCSVMIAEAKGLEAYAEGLYGKRTGNEQFHVGLTLALISFLMLGAMTIYEILAKHQS